MEVVEKVRKARASRAKKKVELSAKDREKAQFAARKAMPKSPIRYHVAHGFGYQNRADLRAMRKARP